MSEPFTNPSDDRVRRYESLQAALDLIDQGFTLFDGDLRMLAWNKTFMRLVGFPPEMAYVGAPFESFLRFNAESGEYGSADPQGYVDERLRLARTFEPHEFERTRPDGTVLRIRGVPVPGHGFVTLYSDITAQKNAERVISKHNASLETRVAERTAELRRSEAQMRLITDSIPALIGYFDRDRVYRYINRGYREWFGLDPTNPSAARPKIYLGAETYAGIRHHVLRALTGEAVTYEYETAILGGRQVLARTTLIPDITADGSVTGCFDLTFDITEERRAQAMLVQAQKMEVLGHLTSGLAHDFNNILTVILGNLAALSAACASDETVAEFVDPAADAARRGAELIKSMLSFSRKQPLKAQANDVAPLIVSVGQMLRRSLPESRQFDIAVGDAPLWACIDAHRLQSTLLNLIVNARDATQTRGRIGVSASAQALNEARAAALQAEPGRYVRIEVSDDGAGMDAQTLARVFEPFFTTKRPGLGTGLGLAMVHDFVKQSGGAIRIESELGQGTTVSLWLPASEASGELSLPTDPADDMAGGDQGLALLVDDDQDVRRVVRRSLLELGFAVIEAGDGIEAMQILDQTQGIMLLVSDVVMPGGIDGRVLAAHARERRRVPRVVLMSGYAPDEGQASDLPVLVKPFTKTQLAALLAAYSA